MRGGLRREPTNAVELATEAHRIECEQRLARIQNGAEPSHRNTPWPVRLINFTEGGAQWQSDSGRKSPRFRSESAAEEWRVTHPKWD
jgi:hypothetical protein